jgi:general secretion pathway protein B
MSFILDALKKSESERHRQSGPVLMDVRIAPPRRRIPTWAWVIAVVLLVNLAVLTWLLWLSPTQPALRAAASVAISSAAPPAAALASTAPTPIATPPTAPTPQAGTLAAQPTAPLADPIAAPPISAPTPVPDIDISTLPKVSDMVASGVGLPELRLSLHVYDAVPTNRYVLLNGSRLREGDFTTEGVRVVAIAPTGVVLEWRGRRMLLSAGG